MNKLKGDHISIEGLRFIDVGIFLEFFPCDYHTFHPYSQKCELSDINLKFMKEEN